MMELIDVNMRILHHSPTASLRNPQKCMKSFHLCVCVSQCHPAGVPGGAVEELGGNAGADAGRERIPGDWVPT